MVMPCKVAPVPQADTGAGGGRPRAPPGEAVGRWTGERSVRDGGVGRDPPPAVEGGLLLAPLLFGGLPGAFLPPFSGACCLARVVATPTLPPFPTARDLT